MKVKVSVKQSDIKTGRQNLKWSCGCPIWHALRRAIPELTHNLQIPSFSEAKDGNRLILLPSLAQAWQRDSINGVSHLYPFSFDVEA